MSGPGNTRRAGEGKGQKSGGNQSSVIALLMESIYTNTTISKVVRPTLEGFQDSQRDLDA